VIFLAWDDWGGFYDHVAPPILLTPGKKPVAYGFGIRVPAITIGAYVKAGTVDHAVYSFDNYTRFIEDIFAGGTRFNPAAAPISNPDSRPYIADSVATASLAGGGTVTIGDLMNQFNFTQTPLPPLVLSTAMPGGLRTICSTGYSATCTSATVTITWESLGANMTAPTYHVQRDGSDVCVTTALKCTDTPPSGDHIYRIYSVIGTQSSPISPANEIIMPSPVP